MKAAITKVLKAVVLTGLVPGAVIASAQDARFRDGRFLETLGGVTLQRADEASADEAVRNMPFLPGDRVWTDASGRAEIVFAGGEILWIAERSKVDSLGRGGREQDERLGLRAFAGSFAARVREGGDGFEFRAPGGTVTTTGGAAFRVDVRAGETTLSVTEGAVLAEFAATRLSVRAGERVRYQDGAVDGPYRFARGDADAFDRWCEGRYSELTRLARSREEAPLTGELDEYAGELDGYGDWVYQEPVGYVYVPRVAWDWAPYTNGRWVYTLYGWTWVASEPWGFVTTHYGRWGYSANLGWHWMPRAGFAGAWVSWAFPTGRYASTVGWCPLGFDDRPLGFSPYGSGGRAVPRGSVQRASAPARSWNFAERSDLGRTRDPRRIDVPADEAQRAVVWNAGVSPDREFRQSVAAAARHVAREAGARSARERDSADGGRRIYVRPSAGDSTPELRSDPATTIPTPESRRGKTIGQDGFKEEQDRRARTRPGGGFVLFDSDGAPPAPSDSPRPRGGDRGGSAAPARPSASPAGTDESATERERSARDPLLSRFFRSITSQSAQERERDRSREQAKGASEEPAARRREGSPRDNPPRDDGASSRDAGSRERYRPQPDSGRERSQPRTSPPPQASPRGDDSGGAARRRPRPDGF